MANSVGNRPSDPWQKVEHRDAAGDPMVTRNLPVVATAVQKLIGAAGFLLVPARACTEGVRAAARAICTTNEVKLIRALGLINFPHMHAEKVQLLIKTLETNITNDSGDVTKLHFVGKFIKEFASDMVRVKSLIEREAEYQGEQCENPRDTTYYQLLQFGRLVREYLDTLKGVTPEKKRSILASATNIASIFG